MPGDDPPLFDMRVRICRYRHSLVAEECAVLLYVRPRTVTIALSGGVATDARGLMHVRVFRDARRLGAGAYAQPRRHFSRSQRAVHGDRHVPIPCNNNHIVGAEVKFGRPQSPESDCEDALQMPSRPVACVVMFVK